MGAVDLTISDGSRDRWSLKPGLMSLLMVAVLDLLCKMPGSLSFFLIPLTLLGFAIGLVIVFGRAVYLFIRKGSRAGGSLLLVALLPVLLWLPLNRLVTLVHLGMTVGFGVGQIGGPPHPSDAQFAVYDWSVGMVGGPNTFLIHDVTDEIALPLAQHKQPVASEDGFGEECAGKVSRLVRHYYVCTF